MVGSAVIKQGRSANRKHTYFFFWPYDNKEGKRKYYISLILVFNDVKTSVYSIQKTESKRVIVGTLNTKTNSCVTLVPTEKACSSAQKTKITPCFENK